MTYLQSAFLGFVQGITEFLPVSSSGHLAIFSALLGIHEGGITFEVFVHFATMLSVVIYFRKALLALTKAQISYIVLASIPAGLVGLLFEDYITSVFGSLQLIGLLLIVTGCINLINQYMLQNSNKSEELSYKSAFIIGIAQAFAILPGVSRSGSTVAAAVLQGVDRQRAFEFSFLLSIPVILGATLLKLPDAYALLGTTSGFPLIIGSLTAFISGMLSLRIFAYMVKHARLTIFGVYCISIGVLISGSAFLNLL